MTTVLIISFSNIANDPRVFRQVQWLHDDYHVVAAGFGTSPLPSITWIPIRYHRKHRAGQLLGALRLLLGDYHAFYWSSTLTTPLLNDLADVRADVIIANDIDTLPLALRLAQQWHARVIFDAHEYFPRQYEDRLMTRIFRQRYRRTLCQTYIPQTHAMITVCQGIADQYERDTGIRPLVITNAPNYADLTPQVRPPTTPRIRMIHHGLAHPSRHIEQMMTLAGLLDERFELDMMLVPVETQERYFERLQRHAQQTPRVRMRPPVPMHDLVSVSHEYDIGLFLLPPTSFSYHHALPNKFFEFLQARLAIAIGPSPEMARIVRAYRCGIVAEDFSPHTLARHLNALDHHILNAYKQRAHAAAHVFSSDINRHLFLNLVAHIVDRPPYQGAPPTLCAATP